MLENVRELEPHLKSRVEAGLIARADDRGDSVVQIAPPLICDRAQLDEVVDALVETLADHVGAFCVSLPTETRRQLGTFLGMSASNHAACASLGSTRSSSCWTASKLCRTSCWRACPGVRVATGEGTSKFPADRSDQLAGLFHVAKHETARYPADVIKGQDILVLLKLLDEPGGWTVRSIGASLELDPAGVHRALQRLEDSRLVDVERQQVNRSNADEFLVHGAKYLFPIRQGGLIRGMPTAWAAPPLSDELAPDDEPPPVWPDPRGRVRGVALEPLHENAPGAARKDPRLAERLALIDAIRLGDGRIRSLATKQLSKSLRNGAAHR